MEFKLTFKREPLPELDLDSLGRLRQRAHEAGLIGHDPSRYSLPHGNASMRLEGPGIRFVVTGTKTSGLPSLSREHYTLIEYDPEERLFRARGQCEPTSEYILHGTIYLLETSAGAVLHSHSPELWNAASRLGMPSTRSRVETKTAELASEIERLFRETDVRKKQIFSIPSHKDGVVSFGSTPEEVWSVTHSYLRRAKS